MVSWIATLFIGLGTSVALTHKSFTLITYMPDKVMRWASGGEGGMNEHADESRANQIFVGTIGGTKGAMQGAMQGISGAFKQAPAPQQSIEPQQSRGPLSDSLKQGNKGESGKSDDVE